MSHATHNPLLPSVYLDIAGKKRKLLFDFNTVIRVDELTGLNLLRAVVSEVEAKNVRALLYASLLHDDPDLTLEEVGSWITIRNMSSVQTAIRTAWFASVEDLEAEDEDDLGEASAQDATPAN
ncbi:MAG: hypothetical protein PW792_08265 [Acidobacteriaceae bacterium]|nr:hypothetical protein [Acidobacteriaceae bacterium]